MQKASNLDNRSMIPRMREIMREQFAAGPYGKVHFDTDAGTVVSIGVLKNPHIAVAYATFPPNAEVAKHVHDEVEWLIVARGSVVVREDSCSGRELQELRVGQSIRFSPHEPHCILSGAHGAEVLAVTVPPDEGFPHAE